MTFNATIYRTTDINGCDVDWDEDVIVHFDYEPAGDGIHEPAWTEAVMPYKAINDRGEDVWPLLSMRDQDRITREAEVAVRRLKREAECDA